MSRPSIASAPRTTVKSHSLSPVKHLSKPYSSGPLPSDTHRSLPSTGSPVHSLTLLKRKGTRHARRQLNTAPNLRACDSALTNTSSVERHRFPFSKPDVIASAPSSPMKNPNMCRSPVQQRAHEHTRLLHSSDGLRPRTTVSAVSSRRRADLPMTPKACSHPLVGAKKDDDILLSDERQSKRPIAKEVNPFMATESLARTPRRNPSISMAATKRTSTMGRNSIDAPSQSSTPPHNKLRRARTQVCIRTNTIYFFIERDFLLFLTNVYMATRSLSCQKPSKESEHINFNCRKKFDNN